MIVKIRANHLLDLFFSLQILQLNTLFLMLLSVTITMAMRALYGPLPFSVVFVGIETFKVINIIKANHFIQLIQLTKVTKLIFIGDPLDVHCLCQLLCCSPTPFHPQLQVDDAMVPPLKNCIKSSQPGQPA